jgi:hypothetical protein
MNSPFTTVTISHLALHNDSRWYKMKKMNKQIQSRPLCNICIYACYYLMHPCMSRLPIRGISCPPWGFWCSPHFFQDYAVTLSGNNSLSSSFLQLAVHVGNDTVISFDLT